MEYKLKSWWIEEIKRTKCEIPFGIIKKKARLWSNYPNGFKASKGWLDKFIKRHNIEEKIQVLKDEIGLREKLCYNNAIKEIEIEF